MGACGMRFRRRQIAHCVIGQGGEELSTGTDVSFDLHTHARASEYPSRILGDRGGWKIAAHGSGLADGCVVRLGLAAVPAQSLCRSSERNRSDLATEAPTHTARGHLGCACHQQRGASAGNRLGHARGCGRTVGRLRLALDEAAGDRPDVCFAHGWLCVDRASQRPAVAHYA